VLNDKYQGRGNSLTSLGSQNLNGRPAKTAIWSFDGFLKNAITLNATILRKISEEALNCQTKAFCAFLLQDQHGERLNKGYIELALPVVKQ